VTDQRRFSGPIPRGLLERSFQYAHIHVELSRNPTAAVFAVLVTLYFWRINVRGIPESSEKDLRIMYITTPMVVLLIAWWLYYFVTRQ
jgi:hypothetical protein